MLLISAGLALAGDPVSALPLMIVSRDFAGVDNAFLGRIGKEIS
jgi:hypothetical protein